MDRVVLVTKATRLEELVREHLTENAAAFALESRGQSIDPYLREHLLYHEALAEIGRQIPNDVTRTSVTREELPRFLFRDTDLVIACGPDGLFANLSKYLVDQLVLTVNPDPKTITGALMLFRPQDVGKMLAQVKAGTQRVERLPFAKATIDDRKVVWAINDIFVGRRDQVSARYELSFGGVAEAQSSSGIIVSTGTGSTGWMSSVITMLEGLNGKRAGHLLQRLPGKTDDQLVFVVREPFPSPTTGTTLITGRVSPSKPLTVTSQMPDGGFIFSDGVIERATEWKAGTPVVISVGDRYVQRIVP
ncbi:MAG: sugar kinase [Minisyncoccia bacterium]